MTNKILPKGELVVMIDNILSFYSLPDEDKNSCKFISDMWVKFSSKESLYLELLKALTNWNIYLGIYEALEDYELCAKIKKVIDYEILEFIIIVTEHHTITDEDIIYFTQINDEIRQQIKVNK